MSDDDTVLTVEWERFEVESDFVIPFVNHTDPTDLYTNVVQAYDKESDMSIGPYANESDAFVASLELADQFLSQRTTNNLHDAWKEVFEVCFKGEGKDRCGDAEVEVLILHAMRLVHTPPVLFGKCVKLNTDDRRADFRLLPIEDVTALSALADQNQARERHDIVQWRVCFELLGKAFELEAWQSEFVKSLLPELDPNEPVAEIRYGKETITVTKDAHDALSEAIVGMSSRPPIFYNCMQVVRAVMKVLGKDMLSYTMPQSQADLKAFDWQKVVIGDPTTYPKAPSLSHHRLESSSSEPNMDERIGEDIRKHIQKLKREAKKQEVQQELSRKTEEEAAAKEWARQLQEQAIRAKQEKQALQSQDLASFGSRTCRTRRSQQEAKDTALKNKEAEAAAASEVLKTAKEEARQKEEERKLLLEAKRKVEAADAALSKKRVKRNDVTLLDAVVTPRAQAELDPRWNPPKLSGRNCNAPGGEWRDDSIHKLALLTSLRNRLAAKNLVPQPLSFIMIMEVLDLDHSNSSFNDQVFALLVFLIIRQKSSFENALAIMTRFVAAGMTRATEIANSTGENVQTLIDQEDPNNSKAGASIHSLAEQLVEDGGDVPTTKEDLTSLGLDDTVVSLLMQHALGSSELVVGLHGRKILVALNMIDWEETGVKEKSSVKMSKLPADKVKKSVLTWIPKGEIALFYDTTDTLGSLLSTRTIGAWGKIKTAVSSHYAPKEKDTLIKMMETICQFYKATKSGGVSTIKF